MNIRSPASGADCDLKHRTLIKRLRYPIAEISPRWFNWGLEKFLYTFQQFSRVMKDRLLRGILCYGPAGAAWLKARILGQVSLHVLQKVEAIKESDTGVTTILSHSKTLQADHIILVTGYRVDIKKLPMPQLELQAKIIMHQDALGLKQGFESSIPGLYFRGFSTVSSYGPLYRFVVGTAAAARTRWESVLHA